MHRHTLSTKLSEGSSHRVNLHTNTLFNHLDNKDYYLLKIVCFFSLEKHLLLCRFCLKDCPPNDLECTLSPYALEYKLLSLPFGIAANQDLIRLVAYTQDGVMHPRTTFTVVDEDVTLPFALRDENLKGVLFTIRALREPHTYRMKVRALSYSEDGGIEYQTTFIVYIAVSAYPY